eukprot:1528142-Amphidinium_carterae.2
MEASVGTASGLTDMDVGEESEDEEGDAKVSCSGLDAAPGQVTEDARRLSKTNNLSLRPA